VHLTDRSTFMIISGGLNIYPQECENLLITHPKVLDAAVFGVPNEDLGEEVKAVVQPLPGIAADAAFAAELIAFCREHLAHPKCPRSIDFTEALPGCPTGKLYKKELRDVYWRGARRQPHRLTVMRRSNPSSRLLSGLAGLPRANDRFDSHAARPAAASSVAGDTPRADHHQHS
jgi:acyl-CoA synthetase (AMP-forming)/AMP-acid ligase II